MRTILFSLLACVAVINHGYCQERPSVDLRDIRTLDGHQEISYPAKATEILTAHFSKLWDFKTQWGYMDSSKRKQQPYLNYYRRAPFCEYLTARYHGDTLTLAAYAIDTTACLAIFDGTMRYWDADGAIVPLYFKSDEKNVALKLGEEKERLFGVRFVWPGLSGEDCVILKQE